MINQTCQDFELILVDDGSRDAGAVMCDNFASVWPEKVRVLHKENGGLIRAWMDGVKISRGQYLCFVDSDDWIDPDMLEKMSAQLALDEAGNALPGQIICCGYLIEYGKGKTRAVTHGLPEGIYEGSRLEKELKPGLLGHEQRQVILSRCMKLTDRKLIEDNLSFLNTEIRMGEDVNIMLPALSDAARVALSNAPLYHYAFVSDSMVHRYDPSLADQYHLLRERLEAITEAKQIPPDKVKREQQVRREYLFLFLNVLKNEIRRNDIPDAAKSCVPRILSLCEAEDSRSLIASYPEPLTDRSYRLLAMICRRPSPLRIRLIRSVFMLYERLR